MLEHAAIHDNILFGHFRHPVKIVKSVAQDCMPNKLGSAILMTRKRIHLSWYTKINSSSTSRSLVIITLIRSQRLWLWAALGVLQTATVFFFPLHLFPAEGLEWMTVLLGSLQAMPFLYRRAQGVHAGLGGWAKAKP